LRSAQHAGHSVEKDWLERFPEAYVLEMQRWTESLHAGDLTGPDAWDGYMALLAVEACVASVESGSTERLQAPEAPGLYKKSLSGASR
jgi:myo-inositol 2-dehydrogenase/D-chiro-inositol 1-dehydrogenase